jgi:hypothetical protein
MLSEPKQTSLKVNLTMRKHLDFIMDAHEKKHGIRPTMTKVIEKALSDYYEKVKNW